MHKQIIYSHGFGVDKTGRGLFTDIVAALPDYEHIMFDYNTFDEDRGIMTVAPFTTQSEMLLGMLQEHNQADQTILIAHSQGCVTAGLVSPVSVDRIILLAPPTRLEDTPDSIKNMQRREGTVVDGETVRYPRRDGTTTIIGPDYWESRKDIEPTMLYNNLAQKSLVVIIRAEHDEVLEDNSLKGLNPSIKVVSLPSNHDFRDARSELNGAIATILKRNRLA